MGRWYYLRDQESAWQKGDWSVTELVLAQLRRRGYGRRAMNNARSTKLLLCLLLPPMTAVRSSAPDGIRNQLEGGIIQSASWT